MIDYEIGCIIFFEKEEFTYNGNKIKILNGKNGIGYSSTKGYFKIEDEKMLEEDIFWITNLPYELFNIKTIKNNIKPENFLGIKIDSLIYELGMNDLHPTVILKELSEISKNTINKLQKSYKITLNEKTLSEILQYKFNLKNINTKKYNEVKYNQEEKNFHITSEKKSDGEIQIYLKHNRYEYIRKLCKTSFPEGSMTTFNNNTNNKKNKKIFEKITNDKIYAKNFIMKYKSVLKVKLTNIDEKIKKLLPANYSKNIIYLNDQEYLYFLNYANIYIHEIFIYNNKNHLKSIEQQKLFTSNDFDKKSISSGLAAYNYLSSFLDFSENSTISNWIKTQDRLQMLEKAIIFKNNGIKVLSYGNASLLISTTEKNMYNVMELSKRLNLIYPTYIL
jgi:hypothetical protein